MNGLIYIYTLSCPITGTIKYVGKTNNLKIRYNSHCKDVRHMTKLKSWIKNLTHNGLLPIMEVIDEVPASEWSFWEHYWYWQLRSWGFYLKNERGNIGIGMASVSNETKIKISNTLKGRKNSWQTTNRRVNRYSLDGKYINTFNSFLDAAKAVGVNSVGIHSAVSGKDGQKKSAGFLWKCTESTEDIPKYNRPKYTGIYKAGTKVLTVLYGNIRISTHSPNNTSKSNHLNI